ncbi:MAG TPA: hypothetical protein VK527_01375 [Candidatus Limnocylindrales bacterium]|nr:hypothetical protein [Candidatus Limnocylindrales bacterium]
MSPQREDYMSRQIRTIAAMIARMIGLRLSGETEKAKLELEEAYTLLLGPQAVLIRRVDAATAARLIGSREKVLSFAQLVEEEAEQESDEGRSAFLRERAAEIRGMAEKPATGT